MTMEHRLFQEIRNISFTKNQLYSIG